MQQKTPFAAPKSQPTKTPAAPSTPAAPLPLDPSLLRHVGGGNNQLPNKYW